MKVIVKVMIGAALVCSVLTSCKKEVFENNVNVHNGSGTARSDDKPVPVRGKVKSKSTHLPISNAFVEIYTDAAITGSTNTDLNGDFVIDSIFPGNYHLIVAASGYDTAYLNFEITSNDTAYVFDDIELEVQ